MREVAKLSDFSREVEAFLSVSSRQKQIAAYAAGALAAAQIVNKRALGRFPPYETTVDGRKGAPLTAVNPTNGVIEFEFQFLDPALIRWIADQLNRHSPKLTGRYQASHVVLADGKPFNLSGPTPAAKRFVFVNTQPYAQKIEKGFSSQSPVGVYQAVAVLAANKYPSLKIAFGYEKVDPSWGPMNQTKNQASSLAWVAHQPAIIILEA